MMLYWWGCYIVGGFIELPAFYITFSVCVCPKRIANSYFLFSATCIFSKISRRATLKIDFSRRLILTTFVYELVSCRKTHARLIKNKPHDTTTVKFIKFREICYQNHHHLSLKFFRNEKQNKNILNKISVTHMPWGLDFLCLSVWSRLWWVCLTYRRKTV